MAGEPCAADPARLKNADVAECIQQDFPVCGMAGERPERGKRGKKQSL